jgi:starch synthase (maltosyl-transferring)
MLFWIEQGITLFAIDNHDTAPLNFWEWLIRDIRRRHPEIILFSKTFARAKLMKGLAKLGFAQSFSYFPWRTDKAELQQYFSELAGYPAREFYRPNLFVNTADVLPYHLQTGEPWVFKSRIALAGTLSGNYGILSGFELLEHDAVPGREEYLDSDKYEVRLRDWNKPGHIKGYIATLNRIRRENKALQQFANIRFLSLDDPETIAFTKQSVDGANTVLCAIALSRNVREFWLPLEDLLVDANGSPRPAAYIENLLTRDRTAVEWGGVRLRIDPYQDPALLFRCTA